MKLTLARKLGLGFGVVLFLMALSGVLTYFKASSIKEAQERAMSVRVPTIGALKNLQTRPEPDAEQGASGHPRRRGPRTSRCREEAVRLGLGRR